MCERLFPKQLTTVVSPTHVFAGHGCRGAAEQSLGADSCVSLHGHGCRGAAEQSLGTDSCVSLHGHDCRGAAE